MSIKGIDVSYANGKINWANVKAAGIKFAIIRSGYGKGTVDDQFYNNIQGAIAQGIPVGVYHFSYALDAAGAKKEADFVVSLLKPYKDKIALPVFFDFEYDTINYAKQQGVTLGKEAFNSHTVAFCDVIKAAGYKAGTYYNLDYYNRFVDPARLKGLYVWYAQYASSPSISSYAIWQYSSSGTISGQSGRFDMNDLKDTSLLDSTPEPSYTPGWHKDEKGWWYAKSDSSYAASEWVKVDNKWYYFNKEGYMVANQWQYENGNAYYLGADGAMVTNRTLKIGADGKLVPNGGYYYYLRDVPKAYRPTMDELVSNGILKGKGGSGDDLILDMSEDAVRVLVLISRTGVFG